jgi:hypothetical protein
MYLIINAAMSIAEITSQAANEIYENIMWSRTLQESLIKYNQQYNPNRIRGTFL